MTTRPLLPLLALPLLLSLASAHVALAQPPPAQAGDAAGADAAPDKAQELYLQGAALYEQGQLADARDALLRAWNLKRDHRIAALLGATEVKLGRFRDATEHLAYVLRNQQADDHPEDRARSAALFEQARAKVAFIKITVDVDGADVFVDDRFSGKSPFDDGVMYVDPGELTISAKKAGHGELQKSVKLAAGGSATMRFDLDVARKAGESSGMSSGEPPPSRVPAFVLLGAGLIAGGAGIGLRMVAGSKAGRADQQLADLRVARGTQQPCRDQPPVDGCAQIKALRDSRDGLVNASTGLLITGGVALAASAGYAIWLKTRGSSDEPLKATALVPVISPSGSGLWLQGAF